MFEIGEGTVLTPCTEDVCPQTATGLDVELHGQFYDAESGRDSFFHDANCVVPQIRGDSDTGEVLSIKNYDEKIDTFCANVSPPVPSAVLLHGNGAKADCKVFGDSKSEDAITCDSYHENSIEVVTSLEENSAVDQIINNSLHVESTSGENYEENNFPDGVRVLNSLDPAPLSSFGTSELNSSHCESDSIDVLDINNADSMKESNDAETDASKIESGNEIFVGTEFTSTKGVTPSIEVCSFDLLDDIIADSRNNKVLLAQRTMVNFFKYIIVFSFLK